MEAGEEAKKKPQQRKIWRLVILKLSLNVSCENEFELASTFSLDFSILSVINRIFD